jgi:S-DNA-T family DNA segregation ATPase FtsK/SpoIIIE
VGAIDSTRDDRVVEQPSARRAPGREVAGVLLLASSVFYLGAILSYPGLSPTGEVIGDNVMGPVGNGLARWSLAAVGLSVYPLALVMLLAGLRLILKRGIRVGASLLLACVSWSTSLAVIFHVSFKGSTIHGDHLAGGAVGELLGEVMCSLFSTAGTYLLALVIVVVTAVLSTDLSVAAQLQLLIRGGKWIGRLAVGLLDRLGSSVIRTAERLETGRKPSKDAMIHAEPDAEDEPVGESAPVPAKGVRGGSPRVQKQKKKKDKTADDEIELEIRPLPDQDGWELPPMALLDETSNEEAIFDEKDLQSKAVQLVEALTDYGVTGQVTDIHPGPVVTLYEYVPKSGTKLSKISGLRDELAMRLEVERVRIVAPIPGKNAVGFEIPNRERVIVGLRSVLAAVLSSGSKGKKSKQMTLPLALGQDIGGVPFGVDLARMPHLIVAGTTGSGKSVCINALLLSLLYRFTPKELRLIMIDPKEVELGGYNNIPHLLVPVVTDMNKASSALRWAVDEMERRYTLFAENGAKNIESFNRRVKNKSQPVEKPQEPRDEGEPAEVAIAPLLEPLPFVVIVLDELADLMMVAARDVETAIARLAQKARAAGIHLVVATQRPSTDVISGTIRNNFPARISFRVATGTDSRTVLDMMGAESLLGAGDMLVRPPGSSDLVRVHGAYVSEEEVERVVAHLRSQGQPSYEEAVFQSAEEDDDSSRRNDEEDEKYSAQYDLAVALVAEKQKASVSMIQRHLRIGYNTAARLMERMERDGVVGPERGSKAREVLVNPTQPG